MNELPRKYEYTMFGELPEWLQYKFEWTDISYDKLALNVNGISFKIDEAFEDTDFKEPVVVIDFPALKKWEISAKQKLNTWIFPDEDEVTMNIEDLDVEFKAGLTLDEHGYLDPIVYDIQIKFGESMITNTNAFLEFVFHGFVKFSLIMI
jgi:hypothetical protein